MIAVLVVGALALLAECARAARDAQSITAATMPGFGKSPDRLSRRGGFWDVRTSWRRKYRDWQFDQRPAWPGSLTWSVALSDSYHALQMLIGVCYASAIVVAGTNPAPWWWWLLAIVPSRLAFEVVFRWCRS